MVFSEILQKNNIYIYIEKKNLVFIHTVKSLKLIRNFYIIFSYNKKFKKYVLTCILNFKNQFIKTMRTRPIF